MIYVLGGDIYDPPLGWEAVTGQAFSMAGAVAIADAVTPTPSSWQQIVDADTGVVHRRDGGPSIRWHEDHYDTLEPGWSGWRPELPT